MPKLLVFAPCERVVIDASDGGSSLIEILQGLIIAQVVIPPPGQTLLIPQPWYAYALFELTPGDDFAARIKLHAPSGREITSNEFTVANQTKRFYRFSVRNPGFPLSADGATGDYILSLHLKNHDAEHFSEIASFPIPLAVDPAPFQSLQVLQPSGPS